MSGPDAGLVRDRLSSLDAYVLDLDGVVTDTASVHATAWKQTFDAFLEARSRKRDEALVPFTEDDYRRYVDGKPRYDGVRSFLESREIALEEGTPSDEPGGETICGLGNEKNERFHELLREDGVTVYDDAVRAVERWKARGAKVAIVSSSRNCAEVLETAGLDALFEVRVDGIVLTELGLEGKPAPDAFLEACRRLDVNPERAAVFEDAVSGVEAGRAGGFALVVGIDRQGRTANALREHGADVVIRSFDDTALPRLRSREECVEEVRNRLNRGSRLALFLDYDGTLTPIVSDPEKAFLSESMRSVVDTLAAKIPVAIVSGRDRRDLERLVSLPSVIYAGSHGFDIRGPGGLREEHEGGQACLSSLDEAEKEIRERLNDVRLERKRYALAVHYRGLPEENIPGIRRVVEEVVAQFPELRLTGGKKIFELRPAIDWDKGRAVLWLLETLGLSRERAFPVYVGDDVTDEDAFQALAHGGLGIVVDGASGDTAATGALESVAEVESFLNEIAQLMESQK